MPKVGMEPVRRRALIDATIAAIAARGLSDVTMADIARGADVSPALAHHYFGSKDDLLLATMRHVLAALGRETTDALRGCTGVERVHAIIRINLSPEQFSSSLVAVWLAFYVEARRNPALHRLFKIYVRRLESNLMSGLGALPREQARETAMTVAALIDGLYLRHGLGMGDAKSASRLVEAALDHALSAERLDD